MPIYEYQCSACGHQFEVIQKVSDALLTQCPKCNEVSLRKMVTAAAFRLKGGGWYETDFKDKQNRKNTVESDSSSDTGTSKPDTTDSTKEGKESKPVAKTETTKAESKPESKNATTTTKPSAD